MCRYSRRYLRPTQPLQLLLVNLANVQFLGVFRLGPAQYNRAACYICIHSVESGRHLQHHGSISRNGRSKGYRIWIDVLPIRVGIDGLAIS